jgi:hypothetical protein
MMHTRRWIRRGVAGMGLSIPLALAPGLDITVRAADPLVTEVDQMATPSSSATTASRRAATRRVPVGSPAPGRYRPEAAGPSATLGPHRFPSAATDGSRPA